MLLRENFRYRKRNKYFVLLILLLILIPYLKNSIRELFVGESNKIRNNEKEYRGQYTKNYSDRGGDFVQESKNGIVLFSLRNVRQIVPSRDNKGTPLLIQWVTSILHFALLLPGIFYIHKLLARRSLSLSFVFQGIVFLFRSSGNLHRFINNTRKLFKKNFLNFYTKVKLFDVLKTQEINGHWNPAHAFLSLLTTQERNGGREETIKNIETDSIREYNVLDQPLCTQYLTHQLPPGLDEGVVRKISELRAEPEWVLKWRLSALRSLIEMTPPTWGPYHMTANSILQDISYFSTPSDVYSDTLLKDLEEKFKVSRDYGTDVVLDSKSFVSENLSARLYTTEGIIFTSISRALQHPEWCHIVKKYLGSVVGVRDNYYACLNATVFSDGTFIYIPPGVTCSTPLSTYFRINNLSTAQLERTLIVADEGSLVTYVEGCSATGIERETISGSLERLGNKDTGISVGREERTDNINREDENILLHAAVVELIAHKSATIHYSTVQNWSAGYASANFSNVNENVKGYSEPKKGNGGVLNFVTKRGLCDGDDSRITWTQVEIGAAVTWKYPSCILKGDRSSGEFYSVAITDGHQVADTGTKMIHLGQDTQSRITSKSISSGHSKTIFRALVKGVPGIDHRTATGNKNETIKEKETTWKGMRCVSKCDSLLIGSDAIAVTRPVFISSPGGVTVEHEAKTCHISEDEIIYLGSRGITEEKATDMILSGFCEDVVNRIPMEFAYEAKELLRFRIKGGIG